MSGPRQMAEKATLTHFMNCYLRETGSGELIESHCLLPGGITLCIPLLSKQLSLYMQIQYWSPTGRHLYELPVYIESSTQQFQPVGCWTAISLLIDDLSSKHAQACSNELLYHVIQSSNNIESYIHDRSSDGSKLYRPDITFLDAEQSLLFGHTFHPTPKSRQGFPEWRQHLYSPEQKGQFQLHYFAAHETIVQQRSIGSKITTDRVMEELLQSMTGEEVRLFDRRWGRFHNCYMLIPVHPVQVEWLKGQLHVQEWIKTKKLFYLGPMGRNYHATSSIRTVFHSESPHMYKFSLQVKITNSMRVNKRSELDGAIEAAQLVARLEQPLSERFPCFRIIRDEAYVTLGEMTDKESGFEVLLRDNPFQHVTKSSDRAIVAAAFTQESIDGSPTLLERIITKLAAVRKETHSQTSVEWFHKYLSISLKPMVWLYMKYGIALEAHLQNCVVMLDDDGYPDLLYFRDSQGYYYASSMVGDLEHMVPGISTSTNVFEDAMVEERFSYYLIVNHLLGIIQAFGTARLIDERVLLLELRAVIEAMLLDSRKDTKLLDSWLYDPSIRCKANMLTRLFDVDELESELEQAVYVSIRNPICLEVPNMEVVRKARFVTTRWREERVQMFCYANP